MSCNICHAPILVHPRFLDPLRIEMVTQMDHLNPIVDKVCPPGPHQDYFRSMVLFERHIEGILMPDSVHAGRGLFICNPWKITGGVATVVKQEEMDGRTTVGCVSPSALRWLTTA